VRGEKSEAHASELCKSRCALSEDHAARHRKTMTLSLPVIPAKAGIYLKSMQIIRVSRRIHIRLSVSLALAEVHLCGGVPSTNRNRFHRRSLRPHGDEQ
jgi:hypothetical protein